MEVWRLVEAAGQLRSQDGDEAVAFANTYLTPYMNVNKNCGIDSGCWVYKINRFNGTKLDSYGYFSNSAKFILSDGTAIHVSTFPTYTFLHFDINGPTKGPNIYGQDI